MFGFGKKIGGVIGFLHIEEFWRNCSEAEQKQLEKYNRQSLSTGQNASLTEGTIDGSSLTRLGFFIGMLTWADKDKQYSLCDKIIAFSDRIYKKEDVVDQHFYLQTTAEVYYSQRDIRQNAKDLCEKYALLDVELFPKYRKPLEKELKCLPRIKTFQRLIIMYEKDQRYDDAIKICKLALRYGINDNTKDGFKGRIEKIEKKAALSDE